MTINLKILFSNHKIILQFYGFTIRLSYHHSDEINLAKAIVDLVKRFRSDESCDWLESPSWCI